MDVFEGELLIQASLRASPSMTPGQKTIEALLKFQGCSDVLCYPEETHLLSFQADVVGDSLGAAASEGGKKSWRALLGTQDFGLILKEGWLVVLAVVFLGGFLTSLTPCVLPVIPLTLMIIGVRAEAPVRRNFFLATVLVLGLSLTYALFGILAVAFGKGLGFVFQEKGFVLFLAFLFFVLSLSMFGFFEIHLPLVLRQRLNQIKGHGLWGAFVSGGAAGVLAAPCAGPVIGALLLFVATTQNYFQGFYLLFIYGIGMGLLFLVLGTGYGALQGKFRGGRFTLWMKKFLGVLLLLGSLFFLNTIVPLEKGLHYLLGQKASTSWIASEAQGLEIARREGKVALIDFYADWCAPCKELDIGFFRRPSIVALLQQMVPIRVDATFTNSSGVETILKKYKIVGWPTLVFVGPDGEVMQDLTVISYNPELLEQNMIRALKKR